MDWSKLFTPDTVAVYITFLGTVIITSIGWIVANKLSKKKPNIIRVSRESATSLLEIPNRLRKNIMVTYKNNEVPAVFQTQFDIVNLGEDVLDNVSFAIGYSGGKPIDVIVEDSLESSRQTKHTTSNSEVKVSLTFINPYGALKDKVKIIVLSECALTGLYCAGGGKAWKAEYVDMLGIRLNYAEVLAKINIKDPTWVYQYLTSSFEIFTKLLKL